MIEWHEDKRLVNALCQQLLSSKEPFRLFKAGVYNLLLLPAALLLFI